MRWLAILLLASCAAHPQHPANALTGPVGDGDVNSVRQLLAQGADPNAPDGGNGWPPLMLAIHRHHLAAVAALLDGGADVNRPAANGDTPLMMAAGYGYPDFVKLLLSRGADPNRRNPRGEIALDYALVGMNDIDRFTVFECQTETTALLGTGNPQRSSLLWARLKHCPYTLSTILPK
jgi:hypothetical protein